MAMPFKDPASPAARASQRASTAKHYQANKQVYIDRARRQREAVLKEYYELKSGSCSDCSVSYPYYVMQWDHLGEKIEHVSTLAHQGYRKRMLAEIEKCELVCANCHCVRTWKRANGIAL